MHSFLTLGTLEGTYNHQQALGRTTKGHTMTIKTIERNIKDRLVDLAADSIAGDTYGAQWNIGKLQGFYKRLAVAKLIAEL